MRDLDGGGLTEAFPAPQNMFWRDLRPQSSGPIEEGIGQLLLRGSVLVTL
jgi:hypothetical protein